MDNYHIVRTPLDSLYPGASVSTFAGSRHYTCQVAGTVANYRKSFLLQGCDDQLSLFAGGKRLKCLRIDYLKNETFVKKMDPVPFKTFHSNTRSHCFRKSVAVYRGDPKRILDLGPKSFRPCFRTENPQTEAVSCFLFV
ncbi:hypothetical protein SDC9_162483 [bioreactor metagenome]|uniref:Uncharacterized protein n=1 Tax=bioreactor metagenome TaxID=1076179 RepID=A0A645FSJ1_9ZZZZ